MWVLLVGLGGFVVGGLVGEWGGGRAAMSDPSRAIWAAVGLACVAALLLASCRQPAEPAPAPDLHPAPDLLPALDRIEERLIHARAIVAHWRAVAAHTEPRLRGCSDQALTRRPR